MSQHVRWWLCGAVVSTEASLARAQPGARFQFERQGYFCVDPDSTSDRLVFNRTVPLRDSWKRLEQRQTA